MIEFAIITLRYWHLFHHIRDERRKGGNMCARRAVLVAAGPSNSNQIEIEILLCLT